MIKLNTFIQLALLTIVFLSCKKDEDLSSAITGIKVNEVGGTYAILSGSISHGSDKITKSGICWSTSSEPTINDNTLSGANKRIINDTITGLELNTEYYARLFCSNESGTWYGQTNSFHTSDYDWVKMADFPGTERYQAISFSYNGKGYYGLGHDQYMSDDASMLKDFWCYDPSKNTWTRLSDYPSDISVEDLTRSDIKCFNQGSSFYWFYDSHFISYNIDSESWSISELSNKDAAHYYQGNWFSVNDKIYCLNNTLIEFKPETMSHKLIYENANPNNEEFYGDIFVINNEVYGLDTENNVLFIYKYDILNNTWQLKTKTDWHIRNDGPPYFFSHTTVQNNYCFIVREASFHYSYPGGGQEEMGMNYQHPSIWMYDTVKDEFKERDPILVSPRLGASSFCIDDNIYFIGGVGTEDSKYKVYNDIWKMSF
ncbi:hypothetical protein [Saccharicrinis aurantiacus]|uniref:hypothetical protein n=1 Tax=Saccharicrinis aurantiacus TaxID=1849719 RepID=UPI00249289A0|nr:hypothetical protein [Saccharicrinis aurantiacus]